MIRRLTSIGAALTLLTFGAVPASAGTQARPASPVNLSRAVGEITCTIEICDTEDYCIPLITPIGVVVVCYEVSICEDFPCTGPMPL